MATYYVENFGCRATQADGAALARQFEARGLARATTAAQADLVILNSCTVTEAADQDARAAIRRSRRRNPKAKIIVTGCYAQRAPQEIAALPGVTCVIGNSHKHQLAEIALRDHAFARTSKLTGMEPAGEGSTFIPLTTLTAVDPNPIFVSDIFAHTELLAAPVFEAAGSHGNDRTRPNLKVQDGCDNRCSFCVIPYVRGQSRSLPLPRIIREVNALVDAGYREVVISGINLGRWGRDLSGGPRTSDFGLQTSDLRLQTSDSDKGRAIEVQWPRSDAAFFRFEDLIHTILDETALEKLRISSVEPMDWSDELIALVAGSPRIAKHAHVPMQSGSDAVLRRMHRKYRPWHYGEKIEKIRAAMPSAAIGADVMAGFPGETNAEFESTRRMIEDLPLTYLHVFTYSPRPGTPAAEMRDQVPIHVARERNRILRELGAEKKQTFMRAFVGKTVEAITLGHSAEHVSPSHSAPFGAAPQRGESKREISSFTFTEALTDNYLKLRLRGHHQPNRWLRARVEDVQRETLIATSE